MYFVTMNKLLNGHGDSTILLSTSTYWRFSVGY